VPDRSLGSGRLRVSYPATHDVGRPVQDRELGSVDTHALLVAALRDSEFEPVEEFALTPRRTRGLSPAAAAPGRLTMDLDLDAGQDAVALIERDGCYSWHLPAHAADRTRTRALAGERRVAHFDIEVAVSEAAYRDRPRDRALAAGPRTRGLLGDLLSGVVRVVVMKFAAPWLVGQAVGFLERHVQPGIIHITDPDPNTWTRLDRLDQVPLPADRPARVLLFIHGTFSSTLSAFGSMACSPDGAEFLRHALGVYDAVVGFDHPTLSVDPLANATDLLNRVASVGTGVTFDVVTHSRGGLTTRSFAEYVLPGSGWNGGVDRVVFVAATNNGTHLADTERWYDLIDITTNLAMVGAGALAGVPGAAPVAAVIAGVVKGLGAFVKYLGAYAVEQDGVPGLAAMRPGGPFVTGINGSQPGQPASGTPWFVGKSDFHVTLGDVEHSPREFPRALAVRLAEGVVDEVFKGPNDLVVDCESMGSIDAAVGGFVADTFDFGTNDVVYHGNYFLQPDFVHRMADWLFPHEAAMAEPPEPAEAGAEPPEAAPQPPPPAPLVPEPHRVRSLDGIDPPEPAAVPPVAVPVAEPSAEAHLLASMTAAPQVSVPTPLRVSLSRKELQLAAGEAGGVTSVVVPASRPLQVTVAGAVNARVGVAADRLGEFASDSFQLPPGGGRSELEFLVEARQPGPMTVTVVVQDGVTWLKSLSVTATATPAGTTGLVVAATSTPASFRGATAPPGEVTVSASVDRTDDQPDFEDYFTIQVQEARTGEDTTFLYVVSCPRLEITQRFQSMPLRRRADYFAKTLADVRRAWDDHGAGTAYLEVLQDVGAELFDQLFPRELRDLLWRNRSRLAPVVLRADEPDVPWELVHLKPPTGRRQKTPQFLGQLGMLRWPFEGYPQSILHARPGRVRVLAPAQAALSPAGGANALEADFLRDRLGASPLPGTESALRTLLRAGDFDLLHFSGHGVADPQDASAAKIVLTEVTGADGRPKYRYLSARAVEQNAKLRRPDGSGPMVVLNACQLARGGDQLTGSGGFAKAFLSTGAAAFVAALWSIHEAPAHDFVTEFYTRLLAGATVADAAAGARTKAREAGDATWLSYVIYARPDAHLAVP